jgi:hypothetical protein
MKTLINKVDFLFPKREIYNRQWPFWQSASLFVFFGIAFYIVGLFIPANGFVAFDWVHVFSPNKIPPFYPPWDHYVSLINWPLLVGLGMAGIAVATLKRSVHILSTVAVLLSLPVFWTIFLGQLEGLVVVGLLALPWLTPLALLKPQVSFFAFGAKKSYLLAFLVWIAISLVIWGFWPARMFAVNSYYAEGRYVQDIAIGWIGIVVALPLFWFSRGDMDMLMVAGAFMTPHLIPYSMLPFTPAVARLKPLPAFAACILSWLPFSSNWLGPGGWWLGWLFVAWLWACLAIKRYSRKNAPAAATIPEGIPGA